VYTGKYSKEKMEGLTNLVNAWIKAMTEGDVNKAQEALLKALEPQERE
jgi:hypothetical protein